MFTAEAAERKRAMLRQIALAALAALSPERMVREAIALDGVTLSIAGRRWDLRACPRITLAALGKAAAPMMRGALQALAPLMDAAPPPAAEKVRGVVVAPAAAWDQPEIAPRGIEQYLGGHPEPNQGSLIAAMALRRAVAATPPGGLSVYLISGGGSALAEEPLPGLALEDLRQTHRALVHSGAPIGAINAVRKHLSALKGGRLALAAPPRADQVSLLLSDVPPGDLSSISSGPTCPDPSTLADCGRILQEHRLALPAAVTAALLAPGGQETPKPGDARLARSSCHVLMDNTGLKAEAARRAQAAGLAPVIVDDADEWEYRRAADFLLERLAAAKRGRPNACIIAGGEVLVKVEGTPGRGGRNQAFALYCAQSIAGSDACVLSLGADGVDGNSPAAGACVDGGTAARAGAAGYNVAQALARFDAYPLLAATGDAIATGPTGNNLRDLRLLA